MKLSNEFHEYLEDFLVIHPTHEWDQHLPKSKCCGSKDIQELEWPGQVYRKRNRLDYRTHSAQKEQSVCLVARNEYMWIDYLECVVETEPVAEFVSESPTQIER